MYIQVYVCVIIASSSVIYRMHRFVFPDLTLYYFITRPVTPVLYTDLGAFESKNTRRYYAYI